MLSFRISLKYSIFLVFILESTQFHRALSVNRYITKLDCTDIFKYHRNEVTNTITFICSGDHQNNISTKVEGLRDWGANCLFSSIHHITFSNCEFDVVPRQILDVFGLRELNLSSISLESLSIGDLPVVNYKEEHAYFCELDLSSNHLTHIDQPVFREQQALRLLDLSGNRIASLSSDALVGLNALSVLKFKWNNLSEITNGTFMPLFNLIALDLSYNQLKHLDGGIFRNLSKLETLNMQWNGINEITNGSFMGLSNLYILDLTHNQLRHLNAGTFQGLTNLKSLVLEWNNIGVLSSKSFYKLHNLKYLDLSFNNIIKLEADSFQYLNELDHLILSHLDLANIEMGAMSPLKKLKTLDLSNNRLENVDFHLFPPSFRQMKSLHLDGNRLTELDDHFDEMFPELKSLTITNNKFNCSYVRRFISTLRRIPHAIATNPASRGTNIARITCDMNEGLDASRGNTLTNVLLALIFIALVTLVALIVYNNRRNLFGYRVGGRGDFDRDMTPMT